MLLSSLLLLASLSIIAPANADFGFSGVEVSPVRFFVSANSESISTASGTINFELFNPTTELSIPFLWSKSTINGFLEEPYDILIVDVQWRKFDNPSRTGGYVGVLARAVSTQSQYQQFNTTASGVRETNYGLGLVTGFRRMISSGFYWGANVNLAVLADDPESSSFGPDEFFRHKINLTVDFLKIGYQF